MKTGQLRQVFLDYFQSEGHAVVKSSSLVPGEDQTLLFTNAGMVQFKEIFLGTEVRPYSRATSVQRCVRAGGKHNDLENVGYTARHHTFFEMLGNFSFGDYFKKDAIQLAWRFLTEVLKLPAERLWVTVFEEDKEAEAIWLEEIGIDKNRFSRCGVDDNFWSMGETGPCGPCTEIFYDHGPSVPGGPPGSETADGDRYIEIWNLVFMQYNRASDGTLSLLPKPSVDTGMGLERIAAVLQGVHSNYEVDIFKNIIKEIAQLGDIQDLTHQSLCVIADHIRSCTFLIMDGVRPSNEGRGYVLRRIARRAIRHGHRLGFKGLFFYQLVGPLLKEMGEAYPDLLDKRTEIERVLHQEEQQFAQTLEKGLKILEHDLSQLQGTEISGETVFKLYDTYGFPVDLTADIAREKGYTLDQAGFEKAMQDQKNRAREASQFGLKTEGLSVAHHTPFIGYEHLSAQTEVLAIYQENQSVPELTEGQSGCLVLASTPFYAEAGGQIGDHGHIEFEGGLFEVQNTRKVKEAYIHQGVIQKGTVRVGQKVKAEVDRHNRHSTALNHSATHLLHAALRQLLGNTVEQKGSLVDADRLRFDFSHANPLTPQLLKAVERLVNEKIRDNSRVATELSSVEDALKRGAMALFGEKYGQEVRVLRMGEGFSVELCGGTHATQTGDIGLFKITEEYGVAAGIRRIEAVTGEAAIQWVEALEDNLKHIAATLKCNPALIEEKLQHVLTKSRQLEKEVQQLKSHVAQGSGNTLLEEAREVKGIKVLAVKLPIDDIQTLRETVDKMKSKFQKGVIVVAGVDAANKINLLAGVTSSLPAIKANELVKFVAQQVGGQGGGKAELAQAGGTQPEHLDQALSSVYGWIEERL